MASPEPALKRRDLETRLIEKFWKDPDFRKEVVRDPKHLLEKHLGTKLPEQVKIYVHEEDANTLHFSIPSAPSNVSELSDEDLGKVAGGTEFVLGLAVVLATAGAAVTAVGSAAAVLKTEGGW